MEGAGREMAYASPGPSSDPNWGGVIDLFLEFARRRLCFLSLADQALGNRPRTAPEIRAAR